MTPFYASLLTLTIAWCGLQQPTFAGRESAFNHLDRLSRLTDGGVLALEFVEACHPSPEANRRAKHFIDRWYADQADRLSHHYGTLPPLSWCTSLLLPPELFGHYLTLAQKEVVDHWSPNQGTQRAATRLFLRDVIARRGDVADVLRTINLDAWAAFNNAAYPAQTPDD
jgi:hypothetical protein